MDELNGKHQGSESKYGVNERLAFYNFLNTAYFNALGKNDSSLGSTTFTDLLFDASDAFKVDEDYIKDVNSNPSDYRSELENQKNNIISGLLEPIKAFKEQFGLNSYPPADDIIKRANEELSLIGTFEKKLTEVKETAPQEQSAEVDDSFSEDYGDTEPIIGEGSENFTFEDKPDPKQQAKTEQKIASQREKLLSCAKQLKESKTVFNSSEYNKLIKVMTDVGNGKLKSKNPKLSPTESFAQELYLIHSATEAYLKHKAKDGIKKNAYKKLVAVERANSVLEKTLKEIGDVEFKWDGKKKGLPERTSQLNVSLNSRQEAARAALGKGAELPKLKNNYSDYADAFQDNNPEVNEPAFHAIIDKCISRADTCMCKIMTHAALECPENLHMLATIRDDFLHDPFPAVQEAQVQDIRDKKDVGIIR